MEPQYPNQAQIAHPNDLQSELGQWTHSMTNTSPYKASQPSCIGEDELEQSVTRNQERMIMACTNGSDGYPAQIEFNRRMENYIGRKKRSERTVVNDEELRGIHRLLTDPAAMRAEPDVSHRTWVKKTFCLRPFGAAGTVVCHKDKGQTIPQPIASKEQMYFVLKQAHASEGHGGRDKTAKAVKKTHSFIRKGLICLFLEVCPTCRARNEAVKKEKPNGPTPFSGLTNSLDDGRLSMGVWGLPHAESSRSAGFLYDDDHGAQAMNSANIAGRRPPTLTESSGLVPHLNLNHIRNNTYPQVEIVHGPLLSGSEHNLFPLELNSQTIFNPFHTPDFQNSPLSMEQSQLRPPFISMNPEVNRLNHPNLLRHDIPQLQQQQDHHQPQPHHHHPHHYEQQQHILQQQHQMHMQRQPQMHSQKSTASPRFLEPSFQAHQQEEFLKHQHHLNLQQQQHPLQSHPQQPFVSAPFQSPEAQIRTSHRHSPLNFLTSNNIYDPTNAAYLLNQRGLEECAPNDDGLLHVTQDLDHNRVPSNNTTNDQFEALALGETSKGPLTSGSESHAHHLLKAYHPSPTAIPSDMNQPRDPLPFEPRDFLNQSHEPFDYQASSGPSTATSFWTRPDEAPYSALTAGVYTAGLEPYTDKRPVQGNEHHRRSSTLPQPDPEEKRSEALKTLVSLPQHRCGSAPPSAVAQPHKSKDGKSLSICTSTVDDTIAENPELPRSAPPQISNPMEKSLSEFFDRVPQENALDDQLLQHIFGHATASSSDDVGLFPSETSLTFPDSILPADIP